MPSQSPMKKRSLHASKIRSLLCKPTGTWKIDIILPAQKPIDASPLHQKRQSDSPVRYLENTTRRERKSPLASKYNSDAGRKTIRSAIAMLSMCNNDIRNLETKWCAVLKYSSSCRPDGSIPRNIGRSIASDYNITFNTLVSWYQKAKNQGTLLRKEGSGRKQFILILQINLWKIYILNMVAYCLSGLFPSYSKRKMSKSPNILSKESLQVTKMYFKTFPHLILNYRTWLVNSEEQDYTNSYKKASRCKACICFRAFEWSFWFWNSFVDRYRWKIILCLQEKLCCLCSKGAWTHCENFSWGRVTSFSSISNLIIVP